MELIIDIVGNVLLYVNRTFRRTTCAGECCNDRCECTNEGASSSGDGEEVVSIPQQHEQEPESTITFTSTLEVRQLSQSSTTNAQHDRHPPPAHHR